MTESAIEPDVLCPRCGYDLRGIMRSWRDSCPLNGRCAECGLDFEWSFIRTQTAHPWLVEFHWRRQPLRSAATTLAKLAQPKQFWSSVKLTDAFQLRPALALMLVAITLPALLRIIGATIYIYSENRYPSVWGPLASRTLRQLGSDSLSLGIRVYDSQDVMGTPYLIGLPQLAALTLAFVWAPLTALTYALIPVSLRRFRIRWGHIARIGVYGAAWMSLPILILSLVETTLMLTKSISIALGSYAVDSWFNQWEFPLTWGALPTLPAAFAVLNYIWWHRANRYYLKLPDNRFTAALLTILSGMVAFQLYVEVADLLGEPRWWVGGI